MRALKTVAVLWVVFWNPIYKRYRKYPLVGPVLRFVVFPCRWFVR